MSRKLYVGNLGYSVSNKDLEQAFSAFGTVESAMIVTDRETGRSKGFGFVDMSTDDEGKAAIAGMNGQELGGRAVMVNEAKPREQRSSNRNSGNQRPKRW